MVQKRLTEQEREEVSAVVRWLYDRWSNANGDNKAGFARQAGVDYPSLFSWLDGRGLPSAPNLLRMLRAADALKDNAPTAPFEDGLRRAVREEVSAALRDLERLRQEHQGGEGLPEDGPRRT